MGAKEQISNFLSTHPELRTDCGLYKPDSDSIKRIRFHTHGLKIKIFTGDWCPDCRIQLPRFLALILALDQENIDLEFIEMKRDMKDELGAAEMMNILAIPTFIFIRNEKELGRIIERPRRRMEEDIAEILDNRS
ncbi:MAG: thioredoxin family protein [Methanomassiliicoccales archaeon]|nr:MAG: thioredoxin family protein [Methanomassiliicoccales archaeon]